MLSNIFDRISFWSVFCVIVLLPLFFLPFAKISVESGKSLLLVAGVAVSAIFWAAARFSDGKIVLPKSLSVLGGFAVVIAFLLSSIFSPAAQVSFFGVLMESGTFYFMLGAFLLLFFSSIILREHINSQLVLWGVVMSSLVALIFQAFRIFMPETLSLGLFGAKTDNLIGSWNSFGLFSGLSALTAVFVMEFFPLRKGVKWILAALVVLSVFFVAAVNFQLAWMLFGVFSLFIFMYKIFLSYAKKNEEGEAAGKIPFPAMSFAAVLVSLFFLLSGQYVGKFLPDTLGLANIEVKPSLATTMSIAGNVLSEDPILGAGPNRFREAWNLHKPASINSSIFRSASFDFGSGLLPTFASTTGAVGVAAWIFFLAVFLASGLKMLFGDSRKKFVKETVFFFMASLYLFAASFFYVISPAMFLLAFAFTGGFIGMHVANRQKSEIVFSFLEDPRRSYLSILFLSGLMLVSAAAGFKYAERLVSVHYFGRTISAGTISEAEYAIGKAIALNANDLYLRTYAQVYAVKMGEIASKPSLSDEDKATLQASLDQAVAGAEAAAAYDKKNYLNYNLLGSVYESVGGMGVEGAYAKALASYKTAESLNPLSPEMKIALSRIEVRQGNRTAGISYAEQALSLSPSDKDIEQYLNMLKTGAF